MTSGQIDRDEKLRTKYPAMSKASPIRAKRLPAGASYKTVGKHLRYNFWRNALIVLDIRMPKMDGIAFMRALQQRQIQIPVVVLTTFDDQKPIQEALQLGAKGFLLKDADRETILNTLRGALKGQVFLEPGIAAKAFAPVADTEFELSQREHEILTLVAKGYRSKAEAVAFALKHHLITI